MSGREGRDIFSVWICGYPRLENPEVLRRLAWRYARWFGVLAIGWSCAFATAPVWAAETSLVSRETAPAVKREPQKEETNPGLPLELPKKSAKKKILQLDDPNPADLKMEGEVRRLQGSVSASSHGGIAVEYGVTADGGTSEMWLPFTKAVKFLGYGYKKYTDIQFDDRVEVVYKEAEGGSKRVLQEVRFLSRTPKENKPVAELISSEGAAEADETN